MKVRLHSAGAASLLHPNAVAALGTPGSSCVAPRSNTPGILTRRALPRPDASLLPGPSVRRRSFTTDCWRLDTSAVGRPSLIERLAGIGRDLQLRAVVV